MLRNKKGALELSITAIVVLIIAITVLGLSIFFIKNLFGRSTELIGGQLSQVEEQLQDQFRESGSTIGFNTGTNIKAGRGKPQDFYLGIKNPESYGLCYATEVTCEKAFSSDMCDTPVTVGGSTVTSSDNKKWFTRMIDKTEVDGNDVYTSPVTLHVTTAPKDTYKMRLHLYKLICDPSNADDCKCPSDITVEPSPAGSGSFEELDYVNFHIEVT